MPPYGLRKLATMGACPSRAMFKNQSGRKRPKATSEVDSVARCLKAESRITVPWENRPLWVNFRTTAPKGFGLIPKAEPTGSARILRASAVQVSQPWKASRSRYQRPRCGRSARRRSSRLAKEGSLQILFRGCLDRQAAQSNLQHLNNFEIWVGGCGSGVLNLRGEAVPIWLLNLHRLLNQGPRSGLAPVEPCLETRSRPKIECATIRACLGGAMFPGHHDPSFRQCQKRRRLRRARAGVSLPGASRLSFQSLSRSLPAEPGVTQKGGEHE